MAQCFAVHQQDALCLSHAVLRYANSRSTRKVMSRIVFPLILMFSGFLR